MITRRDCTYQTSTVGRFVDCRRFVRLILCQQLRPRGISEEKANFPEIKLGRVGHCVPTALGRERTGEGRCSDVWKCCERRVCELNCKRGSALIQRSSLSDPNIPEYHHQRHHQQQHSARGRKHTYIHTHTRARAHSH